MYSAWTSALAWGEALVEYHEVSHPPSDEPRPAGRTLVMTLLGATIAETAALHGVRGTHPDDLGAVEVLEVLSMLDLDIGVTQPGVTPAPGDVGDDEHAELLARARAGNEQWHDVKHRASVVLGDYHRAASQGPARRHGGQIQLGDHRAALVTAAQQLHGDTAE